MILWRGTLGILDWRATGAVTIAIVALPAGVNIAQRRALCWPEVQRETEQYLPVVMFYV